jgi:tetratricopeptide (TPR) repeat protein
LDFLKAGAQRNPEEPMTSAVDTSKEHVRAVLLHPLTLMALGLLALNDHVLRRLWPSPITGKLGDFAWLFFAPLAAAALLELVWPRGLRPDRFGRPVRSLGMIGFGLVGGIFALAKTVPACHAVVVGMASGAFGFPVGWRRDPTDVVALLVMVPAWQLWRHAPRRSTGRVRSMLVLAAALLLTVANSPAPPTNPGIDAVWAADGLLFAGDGVNQTFRSSDGGMTWIALTKLEVEATGAARSTREAGPNATPTVEPEQTRLAVLTAEAVAVQRCEPWAIVEAVPPAVAKATAPATPLSVCGKESWAVCDPADPRIIYSIASGKGIARSEDGCLTWRREVLVPSMSETEEAYHSERSPKPERGMLEFGDSPTGGVVDPKTGNAVFAMGHRGVLVRTSIGAWWWAPVGVYHRMPASGAEVMPLRASTPPPPEARTPESPGEGGLPGAGATPPPPPPGFSSVFDGSYSSCAVPVSDSRIAFLEFWLGPEDADAYHELGLAYYCRGNRDRAMAFLDKAIEVDPGRAEAYSDRARIYVREGRYESALADLNRALEIVPDNYRFLSARGRVYALGGELDRAIADYSRAIELSSPISENYNSRGVAYFDTGSYDLAARDFSKSAELLPGDPIPQCNLGLASLLQGKEEQALAALAKCRDLSLACGTTTDVSRKAQDGLLWAKSQPRPGVALLVPDYAELGYGSCTGACEPGGRESCKVDGERAMAALDNAVLRAPDYGLTYFLRGSRYSRQGEDEKARADYRKALELTQDASLRQQVEDALAKLGPD